MESTAIFQFSERLLCPKNRLLRFSVIVFYLFLQLIILSILYNILNRTEYLYLNEADLVMGLALQQQCKNGWQRSGNDIIKYNA